MGVAALEVKDAPQMQQGVGEAAMAVVLEEIRVLVVAVAAVAVTITLIITIP